MAVERGGAAVRHRVAAAAHPELAEQRRHGEDRRHRAAAVGVALEAPAGADQRRRGVGVGVGEAGEVGGGDPGLGRRGVEAPRGGGGEQRLQAVGVGGEEGVVEPPLLVPAVDQRQRHRQVGAGAHRQVEVDLGGREVALRVDHRDERAVVPRLLEERHQVDLRRLRVGAPDHDGRAPPGSPRARRPASCRTCRAPPPRSARRRSSSPAARRRGGRSRGRRRGPRRAGRSSRRSGRGGSPRRPSARPPRASAA